MDDTGQNLTMLNCRVVNNEQNYGSDGRGAGAYFNNAGSVLLSNCVFQANFTAQRAMGLGFYGIGTTITVVDSEIRENVHGVGDPREGAGFYINGGTLTMLRTTVADNDTNSNDSRGGGGGGYITGATASFTNCIFTGNDCGDNDGAGLYINSGNVIIDSSTFANNAGNTSRTAHEGGAIYVNSGTLTIKNSIFWDNDAGNDGSDGDTIYQASGTLNVSYSCMNGTNTPHLVSVGTLNWGDGIITNDPLFAVEYTDVHLKSTGGRWDGSSWVADAEHSPCIDAGDPASPYANELTDNGGRINMGAYGNTAEASMAPPPPATVFRFR
jgi:hypothetical protein